MFRHSLLPALVLACSSITLAHAQSAGIPTAGTNLDALFPPSSTFATPNTGALPPTFGAPTSGLFASSPTSALTQPRSSALGGMTSQNNDRLTNPVAYLTGSTSGALASPGRYDSGAANRLSTLPTASSTMMQKFQIPTSSVGSPASMSPIGTVSPLYVPGSSPQVYFGTK